MVDTADFALLPAETLVVDRAFCPLDAGAGVVCAAQAEDEFWFGCVRGGVGCGDGLGAGGGGRGLLLAARGEQVGGSGSWGRGGGGLGHGSSWNYGGLLELR